MRYLKTYESFNESNDLYVFDIDETLVKSPGLNEFLKDGLPDPDSNVGKVIDDYLAEYGISRDEVSVVDERIIVPIDKAPQEWKDMAGGKMMPKPPNYFLTPESLGVGYYDNIKNIYESVENKAMLSGRVEGIRKETEEVLDRLGFSKPTEGINLLPSGIDNITENIVEWKATLLEEFLQEYDKVFYYEDKLKWIESIREIIDSEDLILIHVKKGEILGYY